jgi:hypothetical protein
MVSPVYGDYRRCQAEIPLSDLFEFAEPALYALGSQADMVKTAKFACTPTADIDSAHQTLWN